MDVVVLSSTQKHALRRNYRPKPSFYILLSTLGAIVLSNQVETNHLSLIIFVITGSIILAALFFHVRRIHIGATATVYLACFLCLFLYMEQIQTSYDPTFQDQLMHDTFWIGVIGYVSTPPKTLRRDSQKRIARFEFVITELVTESWKTVPSQGTIQVRIPLTEPVCSSQEPPPRILLWDTLFLNGTMEPLSTLLYQARGGYNQYLRYSGWDGILTIQNTEAIQLLSHSSIPGVYPILAWIQNAKTRIYRYLNDSFNTTQTALLVALLLGDKSMLDTEIYEPFQRTGVAHILAVSGLHVGMIAFLFFWLFRFFRFPPSIAHWIVIGILIIYMMLTGFQTSAIRAVLMYSIYFGFVRLFDRDRDSINALSWAAVILLIAMPSQLYQLGFQLSFSAVLSILIFLPFFQSIVSPMFPQRLFYSDQPVLQNISLLFTGIIKGIISIILISLAVQILLNPILMYYFDGVPLISLVTNPLVVAIAFILLVISIIFLVCSMILPPLTSLVAPIIHGLIQMLQNVVGWFDTPIGYFSIPTEQLPLFLLFYLPLIAILWTWRVKIDLEKKTIGA